MYKFQHFVPKKHITNLISSDYYTNLIKLRNVISRSCNSYFSSLDMPKVDLFLIVKGVSSPMGKGSDSLAVPLNIGKQHVYLADSSQFGMEPLVQSSFKGVYCYLPSFRGEEADDRHMNQFFHCEAEIKGDYLENIKLAEGLIRQLLQSTEENFQKGRFKFTNTNIPLISKILKKELFEIISLDEVEKLFLKKKIHDGIEYRSCGRVLTTQGERYIGQMVGNNVYPVWVTKFDRDSVPFYQMPDPINLERTLTADLIVPSVNGSFAGEIIGSGQRQKDPDEILESMRRQDVYIGGSYDWYIKLRKDPNYVTTSGFGLGIERFITWILAQESIVDAAIYPVLSNVDILY